MAPNPAPVLGRTRSAGNPSGAVVTHTKAGLPSPVTSATNRAEGFCSQAPLWIGPDNDMFTVVAAPKPPVPSPRLHAMTSSGPEILNARSRLPSPSRSTTLMHEIDVELPVPTGTGAPKLK